MSKKRSTENLAAKKAVVLGTQSKSRTAQWAGLACMVVLAAGLGWYIYGGLSNTPNALATAAKISGDAVTMPASTFDDGKAHYFEHKQGDLTIRYFVLKSSDGVVRAAFDACDVCWPAGKGYAQDGDFMVCRNCGQRFASVRVNEVKGGCNPAPLERRMDNGMVVIRVSDILQGKNYFNFSGKA